MKITPSMVVIRVKKDGTSNQADMLHTLYNNTMSKCKSSDPDNYLYQLCYSTLPSWLNTHMLHNITQHSSLSHTFPQSAGVLWTWGTHSHQTSVTWPHPSPSQPPASTSAPSPQASPASLPPPAKTPGIFYYGILTVYFAQYSNLSVPGQWSADRQGQGGYTGQDREGQGRNTGQGREGQGRDL